MKKNKSFLFVSLASALGLLALIVFVFIILGKAPSTQKVADEADQLKQANAKTVANLGAGETAKVRAIDKEDFVLGKRGEKTELIVYLDFDCPFSRQFFDTVKKVNEIFKKDISIALRHYPLDSHPGALIAAQAFECAKEQDQDKVMAMADALFNNQDKNANALPGILANAKAIGLKEEDFKTCLTGEKYKEKILAQRDEARLFGVIGAPTSFLNGRNLPGAYQFTDFSDATDRRYEGLETLIKKEIEK